MFHQLGQKQCTLISSFTDHLLLTVYHFVSFSFSSSSDWSVNLSQTERGSQSDVAVCQVAGVRAQERINERVITDNKKEESTCFTTFKWLLLKSQLLQDNYKTFIQCSQENSFIKTSIYKNTHCTWSFPFDLMGLGFIKTDCAVNIKFVKYLVRLVETCSTRVWAVNLYLHFSSYKHRSGQ